MTLQNRYSDSLENAHHKLFKEACSKCKRQVVRRGLECCTCFKWLHPACEGLKSTTYDLYRAHPDLEWTCPQCRDRIRKFLRDGPLDGDPSDPDTDATVRMNMSDLDNVVREPSLNFDTVIETRPLTSLRNEPDIEDLAVGVVTQRHEQE